MQGEPRWRTNREVEVASKKSVAMVPETTLTLISDKDTMLTGKLQEGQPSQVSEKEVLSYLDIPPAAHKMAAILQFGTSFELVDYLARQQIVATAKMAEEHEDRQMIRRALAVQRLLENKATIGNYERPNRHHTQPARFKNQRPTIASCWRILKHRGQ